MDLDEFFKQPVVLKVVRAMVKREPAPMTFRQFTEASGYFPEAAAKLRDAMNNWNLITVESKGIRGTRQQIQLTQYGRELAALTDQMGKILERAAKAKERGTPPS